MLSLRAWRLRRVQSVHDLAASAGVSNKTILDIEHGRVRPKLRTIRRLSLALQVEPTEVEEFARVLSPDPAGESD
jgi:transcriptional regulator with XRE-family HTH domain